jgi:hypothetical protein
VVHQNESDYFQADEAAYNDSDLNAAEATAIEAGWAGEDNVLSRYATEHGQKPLDVAFGDSASQLGVNARQKAEALYGAITNDPLGLVADTVNGAYDSVVTCVTTSTCIAPDQTHGTARDRQLVAELQGNAGAAVAEAADDLSATLVELTAVPGVGKAAKSGVVGLADTAVEQARKNARKDISPGSLGTKKNLNFSSAQLSAAKELGVDPKWINSDGRINWPGNRGFDGTPEKITVEPGAKFDRYGGYYENNKFLDTGKFVSPEGTPFDQRALPNKTLDKPYTRYEVIKPIHGADSGKVASWFDKPGGGTQIDLPMSIGELVEGGFIRPLIKR